MTHIARILTPQNVLLDLQATTKPMLLEQAGALFSQNHGLSGELIAHNLLEREKLGSTGLGHGIAVPHGRIKGLKESIAAFVRLKDPIPFDSPDGQPVQLLVIMLIPDNVTQKHLETLSEIAEMFANREFRTALLEEKDPQVVYHMITSWKPGIAKT